MVALLNNTLSTSFLEPFPCRGKGKGPGTKVEHIVIYVLGQYSKKYRASFILQVNQPTFLHYCLLQGVKQPREITSSLFAIRNPVLFSWPLTCTQMIYDAIFPHLKTGFGRFLILDSLF